MDVQLNLRLEPEVKPQVAPKGVVPIFPNYLYFGVPDLIPLPVFDGLTIIRPMDPKIQAMHGIILNKALVQQYINRYMSSTINIFKCKLLPMLLNYYILPIYKGT